ncbi:MAG TPA: ATP-binding protein [Burkholderiales bacterium]|nr:ATP-binding protein [Burkholderiales bacterium]
MRYFVILCLGLGAVLLFLLSTASANTALFAQHYPLILALNGAITLCLIGVVTVQLLALRKKLSAKVFGAKLTLRLVLFFSLMAVLPGALVYAVSVQFLAKSIESWFDVRVEKALEGGLNLGRTTLDNLLKDLNKKADTMALSLSELPVAEHLTALNTLREQLGVQEATLFSQRGTLIAFSISEKSGLMPDLPSSALLKQIRQQQAYSGAETIPGKGLYLRVMVPVNVLNVNEGIRVLQLLQPVPRQLAQDAETVQMVYRDYQELSLSRAGLKRLYAITLTLTLLLAWLSAIALGFLISERMSAPLEMLAEGTRAVAQGDFSQRQPVKSRDELGVLTQSFNLMTHQLAEARMTAERHQEQLQTAKAYLESVLANLSAGVLAFDEGFRLRSANPSAGYILETEFARLRGTRLEEWRAGRAALGVLSQEILQSFQRAPQDGWEKQVEYGGESGIRVLLLRGTRLAGAAQAGYVVVFDDITHLLQAQRDAAWGEVARRLAHEIKNPLTPIQLSAERLQYKLANKLDQRDLEILKRATQTIISQVAAMQNMVDAFSDYARSPELALYPLDLNRLLREVLALYESPALAIKLELAPDLPQVLGDKTQLRQVIHNLMQNAQDALTEVPAPGIVVRTAAVNGRIQLSIQDNGSGFPEQLMTRLFEPHVTSKPRGTGLGLAIVKKIVDEHSGMIHIANVKPHGACVSISLPLAHAA